MRRFQRLHEDLLEQALHLATRERGRPRQVSLRRAISGAYYALFHLLVHEATRRLLRGGAVERWRPLLARAFAHGEMRDASKAFAGGELPKVIRQWLEVEKEPVPFKEFLDRYIYGVQDFFEYLQRCGGLPRMQELRRQELLLHIGK